MSDEWLDNLKVGDKVFVEQELHRVEKITPTRQIKVDGIERRFIKGTLKGAMQWDTSIFLREWTPETERRINSVKLRMNRVMEVSKASIEMFDDDVLKLLSVYLTKTAQSMTSVRKGDIVTYTRCHGIKPVTGCKVKSNPYIEGKLVYVTIENVGIAPVMTLSVDNGDVNNGTI